MLQATFSTRWLGGFVSQPQSGVMLSALSSGVLTRIWNESEFDSDGGSPVFISSPWKIPQTRNIRMLQISSVLDGGSNEVNDFSKSRLRKVVKACEGA